jgi:peptidoglycan hydrolase-like protein with peptidoglycan-binding domain
MNVQARPWNAIVCAIIILCIGTMGMAWPCGWPLLKQGSWPYEPVNVQTVQLMLNYKQMSALRVDGQFGALTSAAVKNYQRVNGLQVDGVVGESTWRSLLVTVPGHNNVNAKGEAVTAVQMQLRFWHMLGSTDKVDGVWSDASRADVESFQRNRTVQVDGVVGLDTWQLLVAGCNSSVGHEQYGVDIGWPEGAVALSDFQCLRSMGFRFAIFEAYTESHGFWRDAVANAANARAAGFELVEFYHFFNRSSPAAAQINVTIASLRAANVSVARLWFDIEGSAWKASSAAEQQANQQFVLDAKAAADANNIAVGIYAGRQWTQAFGASFAPWGTGDNVPLWYAHYDNIPNARDYYGQPYGAWKAPSIKQFAADGAAGMPSTHCSTTIDWNWRPMIQPPPYQ